MKVTVSFKGTKIVVPCGQGQIKVRELISLAASRYIKAIGKSSGNFKINVSNIKSSEGGMLDSDDLICDVCDDREQLFAIFEEKVMNSYAGDGMSSEDDHMSIVENQFKHISQDGATLPSASNDEPIKTYSFPSNPPLSALIPSEFNDTVSKDQLKKAASKEIQASPSASQLPDSRISLNVLRRKDPLGASAKEKGNYSSHSHEPLQDQMEKHQIFRSSAEIIIPNEIGPLGIHVVPCNQDGRLVVQGIEPGGRIDRDGRLAVGDEIIEINSYSLITISFGKAQEIFKDALFAKELRLSVIKASDNAQGDDKENIFEIKRNKNLESLEMESRTSSTVYTNNTRKLGNILRITLTKGGNGLGFSITTRDNATGGQTPIYVKNILPKGAAIEEGTLKSGDRLLNVNEKSVDGMSQAEVVSFLRNIEPNSQIELIVSRHQRHDEVDTYPQVEASSGIKEESVGNPSEEEKNMSTQNLDEAIESTVNLHDCSFPWKQREILTFDIRANDTERAGLGVSVKGKTSTNSEGEMIDLGIFVKNVLNGGAASRDGRLKNNDQLVNINGISLLGKPNPQAMETLRRAMHEDGPQPGIISLTVARQRHDSSQRSIILKNLIDGKRDSFSSQITSSSDDIVREYNVCEPISKSRKKVLTDIGVLTKSINPVVDRLMGKDSAGIVPSNIRNESYYMATHDAHSFYSLNPQLKSSYSTGNHPFIIEKQKQEKIVIPSNDEMKADEFGGRTDCYGKVSLDCSPDTRGSFTSLTDFNQFKPFSRTQPGRQSMSEKRHATLDAKATDTYQKRKKYREERSRQEMYKVADLKKSASLESFHFVEEKPTVTPFTPEEREKSRVKYETSRSAKVSRSRGCNESFRQAVDRSYSSGKDKLKAVEGEDYEIEEDFEEEFHGDFERSKSHKKKTKLFKNFGAMFRFGSGSSNHSSSKSAIRKSIAGIENRSTTNTTILKLQSSRSVPDYHSDQLKKTSSPQLHPKETQTPPPQTQFRKQQNHFLSDSQFFNSSEGTRQQPLYECLPSAMTRPGSRVGITDPHKDSANSDYDIIQQHLYRTKLGAQANYPGQAAVQHRARSTSSRRPKSNFYEYEMWGRAGKLVFNNDENQKHSKNSLSECPAIAHKPFGSERLDHFNLLTTQRNTKPLNLPDNHLPYVNIQFRRDLRSRDNDPNVLYQKNLPDYSDKH